MSFFGSRGSLANHNTIFGAVHENIVIGETVQAHDAELDALSSVTLAADKMLYATSDSTISTVSSTAYGRSLLSLANEAALKALAHTDHVTTAPAGVRVSAPNTTAGLEVHDDHVALRHSGLTNPGTIDTKTPFVLMFAERSQVTAASISSGSVEVGTWNGSDNQYEFTRDMTIKVHMNSYSSTNAGPTTMTLLHTSAADVTLNTMTLSLGSASYEGDNGTWTVHVQVGDKLTIGTPPQAATAYRHWFCVLYEIGLDNRLADYQLGSAHTDIITSGLDGSSPEMSHGITTATHVTEGTYLVKMTGQLSAGTATVDGFIGWRVSGTGVTTSYPMVDVVPGNNDARTCWHAVTITPGDTLSVNVVYRSYSGVSDVAVISEVVFYRLGDPTHVLAVDGANQVVIGADTVQLNNSDAWFTAVTGGKLLLTSDGLNVRDQEIKIHNSPAGGNDWRVYDQGSSVDIEVTTNAPLNVRANGYACAQFKTDGDVYLPNSLSIGTASTSYALEVASDSAAKPTSSSWTISSDKRVKTDVDDASLEYSAKLVAGLVPKLFRYAKAYCAGAGIDADKRFLGYIAQDVAQLSSSAVTITPRTVGKDTITDFHGLDMHSLQVHGLSAIKHTMQRVDQLEEQLALHDPCPSPTKLTRQQAGFFQSSEVLDNVVERLGRLEAAREDDGNESESQYSALEKLLANQQTLERSLMSMQRKLKLLTKKVDSRG